MATKILQPWARDAWRLTQRQHGAVTRKQLVGLGMSPGTIRARLESGRLHRLWPGIYAVGRPDLDRLGLLMAATPACGPDARLSHRSGAELWRIGPKVRGPVDISVPSGFRSLDGIRLHRRAEHGITRTVKEIPVGDPVSVLIDLATCLPEKRSKTRSLERRFLAIVREAGLPAPTTQQRVGRYRVDFFWPELGFVVETDSLRHHRTAAEQATDLNRDQAHARAGLRTLRFTHSQVFHQPEHVAQVLADALRSAVAR